ncbi:dihydrodipicolinate synthase/N-acetylneuraminate lyase [Bradyrhizobium sp. LB9.1b]
MTEAIRGFWVASATPLATDGSVDSAKLAAHAKQLFGKGVDGVVLFGTTGEGTSFSVAERVATIEAVLKAGVAPERIGIGGGFPAISDSIALTRAVLGLGLRHVLLLPPYFDRVASALKASKMPLLRSSTASPTIACVPTSIISRRSRVLRSRPASPRICASATAGWLLG